MRTSNWIITGLLMLAPTPALAEDLRELCPSRPGLGTPACTVDSGHLLVEVGLGDWTLDRQSDSRVDTILSGDIDLHYGLGPTTEIQIGLTGFGQVRTRDRATGEVDRRSGIGDASLALRQNLAHPDGDGLAVALQPYVTVPTGRSQIGAGDWGGGLIVPITYALSETIQFELTPDVDAAVDEDGDGRHLDYGTVAGVTVKLTETVSATIEAEALRDRDPDQHATESQAALSIAYQPSSALQLDVGSAFGLNHATPDARLYFGVSRRF
jgi:hypothetical protein